MSKSTMRRPALGSIPPLHHRRRTMRICGTSFLFLFLLISSAHAQSICDALRERETVTVSDIQRLIAAGADVNRCGASVRSLSDSLVVTRVLDWFIWKGPAELPGLKAAMPYDLGLAFKGVRILKTLVDAGADPDPSSEFLARMSQDNEIDRDVYVEVALIFNDARNNARDARSFPTPGSAEQKLCDPSWWRTASGKSMVALLQSANDIDPNPRCNFDDDTPLHIALRPIDPVTQGASGAIATLLKNTSADLQARNSSGETPAALLEVRYDRLRVRVGRDLDEVCQRMTQASIAKYNDRDDRSHRFEIGLYTGLRDQMGEPEPIARARLNRDFFGSSEGIESAQQVCEHRRSRR